MHVFRVFSKISNCDSLIAKCKNWKGKEIGENSKLSKLFSLKRNIFGEPYHLEKKTWDQKNDEWEAKLCTEYPTSTFKFPKIWKYVPSTKYQSWQLYLGPFSTNKSTGVWENAGQTFTKVGARLHVNWPEFYRAKLRLKLLS